MRVLVAGGTGLVGRYVVEGLLAAGYEVAVAGRTAPVTGFFSGAVSFLPMELGGDGDGSALFAGVDCFVHAAFHHVPGRYRGGEGGDPEGFRRMNVDGTARLFEAARRGGVGRCVFLSSRAVYDGLAAGSRLTEEADLSPASLYGAVKLSGEQALAALADAGFMGASLRLTGVYGDLVPNKWEQLFRDYLTGRGGPSRAGSEVHGHDVAAAVRLMLETDRESVNGMSFNVSDIVTDSTEILSLLRAHTGVDRPLPEPAERSTIAEMDTQRIRALGWTPGGRDLLERTVARLAREFL